MPDNVLIVPAARWQALFGALARVHPLLVRRQVHANLDHRALPRDPPAAYARALGLARNLETRMAGDAVVGNNLATALDAARGDSLYARVAFLFLGLPGAVISALLTGAVAAAGADRRRRDQALLRARGATQAALVRVALAEALLVAIAGGLAGLAAATIIGSAAFGSARFGATGGATAIWAGISLLAAITVATLAIALPAWRDARRMTVARARATVSRSGGPWWTSWYLDLLAVAGAALVYRATGANASQLVLVAEGSTQVSVNYWSFLAPLLAWIGIALLCYRIAELTLRRGRRLVARAARPISGELADTIASSMSRQRAAIARALALVALTTCFAVTTAAFNATYKQQAEADARLSNGADVVVGAAGAAGLPPALVTAVSHLAGVAATEPLQHRYAYIGRDLQDLYGVERTHRRPQCAPPGLVVRGWLGEGAALEARAHAERHPAERGGSARLPATPRRQAHAASARPAHPARAPCPLHLYRRYEGVPDGAEGRLHHRQRELCGACDARSAHRNAARADRRGLAGRPGPPGARSRRVERDRERHRHEPRSDREQPHERRARGSHARRARLRPRPDRGVHRTAALARSGRPAPDVRHRARSRRALAPARRVRLDRDRLRHGRRTRTRIRWSLLDQLHARQAPDRGLRSPAGARRGAMAVSRRGGRDRPARRRQQPVYRRCARCSARRSRHSATSRTPAIRTARTEGRDTAWR